MSFLSILKEKKNKLFNKENIIFLAIIIVIFSFDRYTKIIVINNFSETSYFINDFINLDLIWNTGIGFGLLSSSSELKYNLVSFFICLVIIFLFFISLTSNKYEKLFFSFVLGGAIGNFYDRLVFKAVPDFIDIHFRSIHWFTFNIADIFISIGIFIYLIIGLFKKN